MVPSRRPRSAKMEASFATLGPEAGDVVVAGVESIHEAHVRDAGGTVSSAAEGQTRDQVDNRGEWQEH